MITHECLYFSYQLISGLYFVLTRLDGIFAFFIFRVIVAVFLCNFSDFTNNIRRFFNCFLEFGLLTMYRNANLNIIELLLDGMLNKVGKLGGLLQRYDKEEDDNS